MMGVLIPIDNLPEWRDTFSRIRRTILRSVLAAEADPLLRECDRLEKSGIESGVYTEAEFLLFAKRALEVTSDDVSGARLGLDLTRVHCEVGDWLRSSARVRDVANLALQIPEDFTAANQVFVSDMVHSALTWQAEALLNEKGVDALAEFLHDHPFSGRNGTRRSCASNQSCTASRHSTFEVTLLLLKRWLEPSGTMLVY